MCKTMSDLQYKYPQFSFIGKTYSFNGKTYIRAEYRDNGVAELTGDYYYCFEDDYFVSTGDYYVDLCS